jgi:hypothetical protein
MQDIMDGKEVDKEIINSKDGLITPLLREIIKEIYDSDIDSQITTHNLKNIFNIKVK